MSSGDISLQAPAPARGSETAVSATGCSPSAPPCRTGKALFDLGQTGLPVSRSEHEDKSLLRRLDHDVAHAPLRCHRCAPASAAPARRSPRHCDARSGTTIPVRRFRVRSAHHGIGVLVVAGPLAAPEIRTRGDDVGQEYQPTVFVRRHRRPNIGVAGVDPIVNDRASKVQRGRCPVRASKARTSPNGAATRRLSEIAEPTIPGCPGSPPARR